MPAARTFSEIRLVNGSAGDPALYIDYPGKDNALLFDSGENGNLDPPRATGSGFRREPLTLRPAAMNLGCACGQNIKVQPACQRARGPRGFDFTARWTGPR